MAYDTIEDLTAIVVRRLSQVPGIGVQTYAEPTIKDALRSQFRIVAVEDWWEHLMYWTNPTLDGSTGVVTAPFSGLVPPVDVMSNVRYIYAEGSRYPLPKVSSRLNPYTLTGTTPRFYEPMANQTTLFRIWPLESTGTLRVRYRSVPVLPLDSSEIPFDKEYMILATVYDYLEDDGGNPGQIEKFRALANTRLEQLKTMNSSHEIPLRADGRGGEIPLDWEPLP